VLALILGAVVLISAAAVPAERRFDQSVMEYEQVTESSYPFDEGDFHQFVLTFRSLIDGLAVAALLMSLAGLVRNASRVRHCFTLYLWMFVLLIYLYHSWFGLWTYAHLGRTTLSSFVVVGRAAVAFLAVQIISPPPAEPGGAGTIDLPAFYVAVARPFLVLAGTAVALSIVEYLVLPTHSGTTGRWTDAGNWVRVAAVSLLVGLGYTAPVRAGSEKDVMVSAIQPVMAVCALGLLLAFVIVMEH
jgi:succinate dehydrogenase hydrophobic anchor subunit